MATDDPIATDGAASGENAASGKSVASGEPAPAEAAGAHGEQRAEDTAQPSRDEAPTGAGPETAEMTAIVPPVTTGPAGTSVLPRLDSDAATGTPAGAGGAGEPAARWSARAQVPLIEAAEEAPAEEWGEPQRPGPGVLLPVLITLAVVLLLALTGVGVWLMLHGGQRASVPTPTMTVSPTPPATSDAPTAPASSTPSSPQTTASSPPSSPSQPPSETPSPTGEPSASQTASSSPTSSASPTAAASSPTP